MKIIVVFVLAVVGVSAEARDFFWGVSLSSYQSEDVGPSSFTTDWDLYYKLGKIYFPKGEGTKSYTQTDRDIEALRKLGVTHYRFSIEWARVEPEPGKFDEAALQHYVEFAKKLMSGSKPIIPVVTLWHFTFPSWLCDFKNPDKHGWLNPQIEHHWLQFVHTVVSRFGSHATIYAPQNEPNTYALSAYFGGGFPPGAFDIKLYERVVDRSAELFVAAAKEIHDIAPQATVMSVQNVVDWKPSFWDWLGMWMRFADDFNYRHLDLITQCQDCVDLLGFNYYFQEVATPLAPILQRIRSGAGVSDMGWIISPEGLDRMIHALSDRYRKPLVIAENGIADRTDTKRMKYLRDHVDVVLRLRDTQDVRGYFHWSLLDNYEWTYGYGPKFGLFKVSSNGETVSAKQSALLYTKIIQDDKP
jgi:beta-glucosidase